LTDNKDYNKNKNEDLFIQYSDKSNIIDLLNSFETKTEIKNLIIYYDNLKKLKTEFKSKFIKIDAGGGLVVNNKNQYLFIKRLGKWDLPKGKKEKSEKISETALREVSEECGINNLSIIKKLNTTYHYYYINDKRILKKSQWYLINYDGKKVPTPQTIENITEAKWFDKSELEIIKKNTYPSILDVIYQYFD
jgi:8-oxo-dGTP pyrophosphatase MutT (NUDIX family)